MDESPVKILLPFLCLLGLIYLIVSFPQKWSTEKSAGDACHKCPTVRCISSMPRASALGSACEIWWSTAPKAPQRQEQPTLFFSYIQMLLFFLYFFFIIQTCLGFLILLAFCHFAKIGLGFATDILRLSLRFVVHFCSSWSSFEFPGAWLLVVVQGP